NLLPQYRIGEIGRSRGLAVRLDVVLRRLFGHHGFPVCSTLGRSVLHARLSRKAFHQLTGFQLSLPLSEKVMNSARPPMSESGTGPPSPLSSREARLSAE